MRCHSQIHAYSTFKPCAKILNYNIYSCLSDFYRPKCEQSMHHYDIIYINMIYFFQAADGILKVVAVCFI